ncbi:acyltransferase [Rhizobium leguminosarum]|uniref:acyltransferase family protein n=1 Tax=Rhizobium leguminosarum TaxID=384 RepID=UPI001C9698BB|nr:acyltransferase [Rhizobium leguminosarum]MBY5716740.1 acyltransferase [Rhizobium leguminosarum]
MTDLNDANKKKLGLQYLRAIAAILVVAYHADGIFHRGGRPFFFNLHEGRAGVDLFFVLSGYVIMHAHSRHIGVSATIGSYLWKRIWRVFPLATLATAFTFGLVLISGEAAHKLKPWSIAASFMMIAQDGFPVLNVTWTLAFEIFFYAVFASWIVSVPLGCTVVALWACLAACFYSGAIELTGTLAIYCQPIILEFALGILVYLTLTRSGGLFGKSALVAGATLFIISIIVRTTWDLYPHQPRGSEWEKYELSNVWIDLLTYGAPSALLIYGTVACDKSRYKQKLLGALGDASFAIYLFHRPVMLITDRLIAPKIGNDTVTAFFGMSIAVFIGYLLHCLVDEHIQNWGRSTKQPPITPGEIRAASDRSAASSDRISRSDRRS